MELILFYLAQPLIFWLVWGTVSLMVMALIFGFLRNWVRDSTQYKSSYNMTVLRVLVPKDADEETAKKDVKDQIAVMEAVFSSLGGLEAEKGFASSFAGRTDHMSFEIVADRENLVSFYVSVPQRLQQFMEQQLHAQYPDAIIEEVRDYNIFEPQGIVIGSDLKLQKSYALPIQTYDKMPTDPLNGLTNVLSKFETEEGAIIQIVLRPAPSDWRKLPTKVASEMQQGKKYDEAVKASGGGGFGSKVAAPLQYAQGKDSNAKDKEGDVYRLSPAEDELVKNIEDKASKAGFEANIRVLVSSDNKEKAKAKLNNILQAFSQFSGFERGNSFKAHKPTTGSDIIDSVVHREFDQSKAMILNATELTSIWHPPLPTTETPNIRWLMAKKSPPPANMPREGVILGTVKYRGQENFVRIKREDRMRHMYVIGKSGSGKSEALKSIIQQDMENGDGVCVMDPHGELADDCLELVPKNRIDDVIYFDPGNTERPMGLNMLEYNTKDEMDFAVQEMVSIFYKLFGSEMIGPMFEHYMKNAMLALMADKEAGATIVEVPRMFTDEKFRKERVAKVENDIVKNFWLGEFEQSQQGQQAADMLSYVISKIGRFLTNDLMRNIIGQKTSAFDFSDVMNNQKILLVNLSKGRIGEVNSSLLGLIIVSKLQMAAMARANLPKDQRKDFFVYLDEFQNFLTDSIATILSEARKYRFSLNIAHQYIGQLVEGGGDTKIRDAIFGNVGTMMSFRVGAEDAEFLSREFAPEFSETDIINVEQFTANVKLLIDNNTSRPFNMSSRLPKPGSAEFADQIKQLSYSKYGEDRAEIEADIKVRSAMETMDLPADDLMEGFF